MTDTRRTIVRPDQDGEPDDIVIDCEVFRMERMDRDHWSIAVYRGKHRVCFSIRATRKGRINVEVYDDQLGCIDDTEMTEQGGRG